MLDESLHGSFVAVDLEVPDHRAAGPRDEYRVLGRIIQGAPTASTGGQCDHHLQQPFS